MKKEKLHITARSLKSDTVVDLYYYSIAQAQKFNPNLTDFQLKGVYTENKENVKNHDKNKQILLSKNKLVLLSKLLKDVKNSLPNNDKKEEKIKKLNIQRRMVEILISEQKLDKMISKLSDKLKTGDEI